MTTQFDTTLRELHSRKSDGIDVRLLWCECDQRVVVSVTDSRTNDAFTLEVRDGERALDVFHHPYAYAEVHGVDTSAAAVRSAPLMKLTV